MTLVVGHLPLATIGEHESESKDAGQLCRFGSARAVQAQPKRDATAPALTVDPHSGKLRTHLIRNVRLVAAMPLDRSASSILRGAA